MYNNKTTKKKTLNNLHVRGGASLATATTTLAVVAAFKSSGTTQVFSMFYETSFIASPKGSKKKQ